MRARALRAPGRRHLVAIADVRFQKGLHTWPAGVSHRGTRGTDGMTVRYSAVPVGGTTGYGPETRSLVWIAVVR